MPSLPKPSSASNLCCFGHGQIFDLLPLSTRFYLAPSSLDSHKHGWFTEDCAPTVPPCIRQTGGTGNQHPPVLVTALARHIFSLWQPATLDHGHGNQTPSSQSFGCIWFSREKREILKERDSCVSFPTLLTVGTEKADIKTSISNDFHGNHVGFNNSGD